MGMWDKAKQLTGDASAEARRSAAAAAAELRARRAGSVVTYRCDYIGGHEAHPDGMKDVTLRFSDEGVSVMGSFARLMVDVPWGDVRNLAVEGRDEIHRRITATRIVLTGVFALALRKKKRDKEAYVTVSTAHGDVICFIEKSSPHEVTAKLGPYLARVRRSQAAATPAPAQAASTDLATQLRDLAKLRDEGILSPEEFEQAKSQLLAA
jgi:hypothetical protein